ncbi:hypothetical protein [Blastococcus sp. PRF04-17]|uniref:hypothetical protein n=1 Tax=Blastococcus sp. PRF04-17 TaxID=2933797 RepID=UPI001FF2259F|nr:hypothetical protein [Blastococcus sp. PRF04-17]UOY01846.1 hypothetical protein MVA48_00195 [Blastococcus sp. PRF04-17]
MSGQRLRRRLSVLVVVLGLLVAGCSGTEQPADSRAEPAVLEGSPLDSPDPVPEPTGEGTEVGPDGGDVDSGDVEMSVPAGAVPAGHTFTVPEHAPIPAQPGEIFGRPVALEHDVPLASPVTVRWTLPALDDVQRASLLLAKWDADAKAWVSRPDVAFEVDGDTLTAELSEFSCCWDWIANAGQSLGELVGARRDAPKCNGKRLPGWVRQVVDPDEGTNAAAIRVCFEPDTRDEIVTTRVVNNRPFAQRLHMTAGDQRWAWTWPGQETYDVASTVYGAARTVFDSPTSHLMPPLSETAVGIGRPGVPGQVHIAAQASVDPITLLVDVVKFGFEQVDIGGTDNFLLDALAQAMYSCGGGQLLGRPNLKDPAEIVRTALDVVGSCADEIRTGRGEFGHLFEELSRAALARAGQRGDDVVIKVNRLTHAASAAFKALTYAKVAFYLADELQNQFVGPLTLSVRGDGRAQGLGAWTPTCTDTDADSNRLFRNLALRDEFADTSREYWQFPGWAPAAARAVAPLRACTAQYRTSLADLLPGDWGDPRAARVVADAIRALVPASGSVTLSLGGTFEGTDLFAPEDDVMAFLTERLGPPDDVFDRAMCEMGAPPGRRVTWGNLTVLFVDDGNAYLAGSLPPLDRPGPIAVGWEYWRIKTGGDAQGLRTDEGIGLGASLDDVTAAYPDAQVGEDFAGTYAQVFRGDFSGVTFSFADGEVVAISSGGGCGE